MPRDRPARGAPASSKILVQGVQTQLVPRLLEVNGWRTDRCPEVYHTETPDLAKIGDYLSKLHAAPFPFDWQNNPLVQHLHLLQITNLPARAAAAVRREAGGAESGDRAEPAEPDATGGEPASGDEGEAARVTSSRGRCARRR